MRRITLFILVMLILTHIYGFDLEHDIYVSGEYQHNSSEDKGNFYLEYYPSLQESFYKSGNISMDSNLELMTRAAAGLDDDDESELDLKVYRLWLRSTAEQSEFRIGLQKINFGPARYLRSLQWFDRIDPLDPRQQTEGVWSMLLRYYSLDNSNYWFWAIYNEPDLKGIELVKTREETLEMGGRIQLSILGGDLGFSYHTRGVEDNVPSQRETEIFEDSQERRIGFDGCWDIGIGLWQETSISIYDGVEALPLYAEFYTLGADYTFDLGNGLHLLTEHQYFRAEDKLLGEAEEERNVSLLTADYPIGLYDSITGLVAYDHQSENAYYYVSYNRMYNYLSIYLNFSYKPEGEFEGSFDASAKTALQLLLQFNY